MKKLIVPILLLVSSTTDAAYKFEKQFGIYDKEGGPGIAVSVVHNGEFLFKGGFGLSILKKSRKKTKITPQTSFNLASDSKQFTALAALLLMQENRLSFDDPIEKFIPEAPEWAKHVRIRDLIYHTSGLPDYMDICEREKKVHNEDVLQSIFSKGKLDFPSGTRFEYSNSGYVVLSEVIQRASMKKFPDFIFENIFSKLGMTKSMIFSENTEKNIPSRALGYGEWPFFKESDYSSCNYNYGDGGVYTSIEDFKKWTDFLSEPSKILKPEFQTKLFESGTTDAGEDTHYALGWMIDKYNGQKMIFHGGGWLGFRSIVVYLPESNIWVTILSNYKAIFAWDAAKSILDEVASQHPKLK